MYNRFFRLGIGNRIWFLYNIFEIKAIENDQKKLITLDAETGADAHCQGNNALRLVQEVETWLKVVLSKSA
jgi:hypothetical protein